MDIVLTTLLALATFRLAYLGVKLTLEPPESPETRKHYRFVFIVLGCVIVFLSAWQTYRSSQTQDALQARLDAIEQNTKKQPERSRVNMEIVFVTDRLPPFTSKNSFVINIRYRNVSDVPANVTGLWEMTRRSDHVLSADEEDKLYSQLLTASKSDGGLNTTLGPGQASFITVEPTPLMTAGEAELLASGKAYIYSMALVRYKDDVGLHETDLCKIFWGVYRTVHNCRGHDGPRS